MSSLSNVLRAMQSIQAGTSEVLNGLALLKADKLSSIENAALERCIGTLNSIYEVAHDYEKALPAQAEDIGRQTTHHLE